MGSMGEKCSERGPAARWRHAPNINTVGDDAMPWDRIIRGKVAKSHRNCSKVAVDELSPSQSTWAGQICPGNKDYGRSLCVAVAIAI